MMFSSRRFRHFFDLLILGYRDFVYSSHVELLYVEHGLVLTFVPVWVVIG